VKHSSQGIYFNSIEEKVSEINPASFVLTPKTINSFSGKELKNTTPPPLDIGLSNTDDL